MGEVSRNDVTKHFTLRAAPWQARIARRDPP
jgi:hypothetical protein